MNIEIKAGEDGKITTAGKLDIDTPNTHMNNIDVTGKALVSQMVNTSWYRQEMLMVQQQEHFGQPGAYARLGGYGASPKSSVSTRC